MKLSDTKILQHIRHNARINLTTLSRKTGIPVSTIFDRIRTQEQTLITRFTALVDFAKLGYPVRANIFLKVEQQHRDGVRNFLLAHRSVNNLFRINNGYDFAAECVFTSIRDIEEFIEQVEGQFHVLDRHVYHIIDDLAREKVMSSYIDDD